MRLLIPFLLSSTFLSGRPLTFERRSDDLYRASFAGRPITVRPGLLSFSGINLRFAGSNSAARIEGIGQPSPATYIRAGFNQTFPQYSKVALREVYPGIDLILYGNGDDLEYDLVAEPGANVERLRMIFEGALRVRIDRNGDLSVTGVAGSLIQKRPRVFEAGGRQVDASYVLGNDGGMTLKLGPHDPRLTLTIDPELVFTKSFGGSGRDTATSIATDSQGKVYITGNSNSVDFPGINAFAGEIRSPLAAIGNGGVITALPLGVETSVLAIGGTADGAVIYAFCPDATYVSSDQGKTWDRRAAVPSTATISSISVDPVDPARMFVATNGGLYFTDTGGEYWGAENQGLPNIGNGIVRATWVAISPIDHETTYVVLSGSSGLYQTTNAGATWNLTNPIYSGQPSGLGFQQVSAVLSADGNRLYFIDRFGTLLLSTDGSATWQVLAQQLYGASSIVLDPANPSNLYLTDYSGIQSSSDGGLTFNTLLARGAGVPVPAQLALAGDSQTLYFGAQAAIEAIPTAGGAAMRLAISTPNLHWLATLGTQVYTSFDTPSTAYVIKWDPTGQHILYSTFFGGSLQDNVSGIVVDPQGEATVAGYTDSPDFPTTASFGTAATGSQQHAFITRLSVDGTKVIYSDVLGQTAIVEGLALDASGSTYVTGETRPGANFPISANAFQSVRPLSVCNRPSGSPFLNTDSQEDGFVSKIGPDGNLVYSTLLTGSCGSNGIAIAVDSAGQAVVAGYTTSSDFPATAGAYQPSFPGDPTQILPPNTFLAGFAAKIGAAGDRVIAATYLGGSYQTMAYGVTLDAAGNAYITGGTAKILPGATPGAYQTTVVDRCAYPVSIGPSPPYGGTGDVFVLKLDPTLTTAGYLTYLGGGCDDYGNVIALDSSGNAWINGQTQSPDFPLKAPFEGGGVSGRFVSEISPNGSQLLFSSATDGRSLVIGATNLVYLAGSQQHIEWTTIDPSKAPPITIDTVQPLTAYPPSVLTPSFTASAIVPGELVQITGYGLGPAAQVNGQPDATGRLPFLLANTIVTFDNIPAPLVSVSDTAITCYVPFEVGQTTNIVVKANGVASNTVHWGTQASSPQILYFTNQDGSVNSAVNPAHPGDVLQFFLSGMGETQPLSADGLVNEPPLAVPTATLYVSAGGHAIQPQFVGAAPGQPAGIVQVNIPLPSITYSANPTTVGINNAWAPVYISQ